MGAWGAEIFDDPDARAVRAAFEAALARGLSVPEASQAALDSFAEAADDPARGPAVYLALAALQTEHGCLQVGIRKRALAVIYGGHALEPWKGRGPEALAARERVLEELKWRLH